MDTIKKMMSKKYRIDKINICDICIDILMVFVIYHLYKLIFKFSSFFIVKISY
jgi:hypothetical protein